MTTPDRDGWLPWVEDATGTLRPPKDYVDLKAGETREDRYDYDGQRLHRAWSRKVASVEERLAVKPSAVASP
jgi:hypothetical protein